MQEINKQLVDASEEEKPALYLARAELIKQTVCLPAAAYVVLFCPVL